MSGAMLWERYRRHLCVVEDVGLGLDVSRMRFDDAFLTRMDGPMAVAFDDMEALERGAIANVDEGRMVGHYWLRAPALAPTAALAEAITTSLAHVRAFASDVHSGRVRPGHAPRFTDLLVIGIGGSALGPQFVADALGSSNDRMRPHFIDNTDPDGVARTLARIGDDLATTLTVVTSKSGGTKETRNGMLLAEAAYRARGLDFPAHAVAITSVDSALDVTARSAGWLARFPMWDWVGGRTSAMSAVGLVPAALQGLDVDGVLAGARAMDIATRRRDVAKNPAALLALMWYHAGGGRGTRDMVVLPYKDRLLLFSRYLQQLVMESLGKERDRDGRAVHQGIAVYGNKGSTDQHAYVQQLRDGVNNFFVTFIQVLRDQDGVALEVEPQVTAGDYLLGFLLGTREALQGNGRESITITLPDVSGTSVGALIALYERAVGLYASLIGVNAYHQPGVEAGKQAATAVIALQAVVVGVLDAHPGVARTAADIAGIAAAPDRVETVHKILEHLAANGRVRRLTDGAATEARYLREATL